LAVADTCYAFSYSLNEEAQESEYSASVRFACGTPELSTYNLQKVRRVRPPCPLPLCTLCLLC
jgi:hypothetical protein